MLPSYSAVAEWAVGEGYHALPAPTTKPTRKGIGRYIASILQASMRGTNQPTWWIIYASCTAAYQISLDVFDIRLPYKTFVLERAQVENLVWLAEDDEPMKIVAYRWATRRK